ncbi:MAG: rhomboid family intramembrane serine protease [Bacteroides sp.]
MNWFDKLERKYGKYAIKNLMYYIIAIYAFGFILEIFFPNVYDAYLSLDAEAILHGQIWRIVTFIMQPPSTSVFWIFFSLYMYYMIGTVLENVWGSFRFNVYFFMGVLLNVAAAIIIYLIFGVSLPLSTYYINLALFMAFAMIAPDAQVLLFFIIPIKIKWLAYFDGIYIVLTIIVGYLSPLLGVIDINVAQVLLNGFLSLGLLPYAATFSSICSLAYINATAAFVSMLNFFVFWLMTRKSQRTKGQKMFRKAMKEQKHNYNRQTRTVETNDNRQDGRGFIKVSNAARHCCAVCHRTELDAPELEFRFCSKCEGNYEYCSDHLYTHVHVKK